MKLCVVALMAVLMAEAQQINDPPEFLIGPRAKPSEQPSDVQLEFFMKLGNFEDSKPADLFSRASAFLAQHPDFGGGYGFRARVQYCGLETVASAALLADVDKAIDEYSPDTAVSKLAELYSLRARLEYDLGRYQASMDDLGRGVNLVTSHAEDVMNAEAANLESRTESGNPCDWTETELSGFKARFPNDYRVPLFRGLFLLKGALLDDTLGPKAIGEFRRSLAMNPKSALPHYAIGRIHYHTATWGRGSMSTDASKDAALRGAVTELAAAIDLDRMQKGAYYERAGAYLHLKQYAAAIRDYDRVIEIDPKDAGALHDRALAWEKSGNWQRALVDYNRAIELGTLNLYNAYDNRGQLYEEMGLYQEAVADVTHLIRLHLDTYASMGLALFRSLYPEYDALPESTFIAKLHDVLAPQLEAERFVALLKDGEYRNVIFPEAYLKRSDLYSRIGQFRRASADYNRAIVASNNGGERIERWRPVGKSGNSERFIDMRTIEFTPLSRLWLKTTKAKGYELQSIEVDCVTKMLRVESAIPYDYLGRVSGSDAGAAGWNAMVPGSTGENLYEGMCRVE